MSQFQITPIGVGIIGIYALIILLVLVWPISRKLKTSRLRRPILAIVAVPFLAAPWAEEACIAWHFSEACRDAGVKVYRQVEVEGYVDDTNRGPRRNIKPGLWKLDPGSLRSFDSEGYHFRENMLDDGGVLRVERHPGGLMAMILDHPTARYRLRYAFMPTSHSHEEAIGWRLAKVERQVVDSQTGEILGREITFKRRAAMVDFLWAQLVGSTLRLCPGPSIKSDMPPPPFPQAVLIPISRY